MGIGPRWSSANASAPGTPPAPPVVVTPLTRRILEMPLPNPDPKNFKVEKVKQFGPHVVAQLRYPDATNYEGRKILVFLHTTVEAIRSAKVIDPHFTDDARVALRPFARFEPTIAGWDCAVALVSNLI